MNFSMIQNRLSDVAMVWLQVLQPWNETNLFALSAERVGRFYQDPRMEQYYQVFQSPIANFASGISTHAQQVLEKIGRSIAYKVMTGKEAPNFDLL